MIDEDNEDDVIETSCIDSQEVEIRTQNRLDLVEKAVPDVVLPNSAFKPYWLDR